MCVSLCLQIQTERDGTFVLGRVLPLFNTATAVVSLPTMILSSMVLIAKQPTLDILRLDE